MFSVTKTALKVHRLLCVPNLSVRLCKSALWMAAPPRPSPTSHALTVLRRWLYWTASPSKVNHRLALLHREQYLRAKVFTGWVLFVEEQKNSRWLVAKVKAKVKDDAANNSFKATESFVRKRPLLGLGYSDDSSFKKLSTETAIINRLIATKRAAAAPASNMKSSQSFGALRSTALHGQESNTPKRTHLFSRISTIGTALGSRVSTVAKPFSRLSSRQSAHRLPATEKDASNKSRIPLAGRIFGDRASIAGRDAGRAFGGRSSLASRSANKAVPRAVHRRSLMSADRAAIRLEARMPLTAAHAHGARPSSTALTAESQQLDIMTTLAHDTETSATATSSNGVQRDAHTLHADMAVSKQSAAASEPWQWSWRGPLKGEETVAKQTQLQDEEPMAC